jgi:hypothetical protein
MPERTIKAYTAHFWQRLRERGIPFEAALAALNFGRSLCTGDGWAYLLDHRAAATAAKAGFDVKRYLGIRVVITPYGKVVTVY